MKSYISFISATLLSTSAIKKINIGRPQVDCTVHTVYVSAFKKLTQPLKNSYGAKERLFKKSTN